jgi:hypothetical protein
MIAHVGSTLLFFDTRSQHYFSKEPSPELLQLQDAAAAQQEESEEGGHPGDEEAEEEGEEEQKADEQLEKSQEPEKKTEGEYDFVLLFSCLFGVRAEEHHG